MHHQSSAARAGLTAAALGLSIILGAAGFAAAGEKPTAAEIEKAVSDHTYQGSMSAAGSVFAEFYAADGSIKADGYTGKWRADDGTMCFQYGDKPERCFGVELQGPSMVMLKDGEIDGNGMLIPGNVNGF